MKTRSHPNKPASRYHQVITCCLGIDNISYTNIQEGERLEHVPETSDWPTASIRFANHTNLTPPTSAQERAVGSFPVWSYIRSWYKMAYSRNSLLSGLDVHFTFPFLCPASLKLWKLYIRHGGRNANKRYKNIAHQIHVLHDITHCCILGYVTVRACVASGQQSCFVFEPAWDQTLARGLHILPDVRDFSQSLQYNAG